MELEFRGEGTKKLKATYTIDLNDLATIEKMFESIDLRPRVRWLYNLVRGRKRGCNCRLTGIRAYLINHWPHYQLPKGHPDSVETAMVNEMTKAIDDEITKQIMEKYSVKQ